MLGAWIVMFACSSPCAFLVFAAGLVERGKPIEALIVAALAFGAFWLISCALRQSGVR